ncbi:MAG TPA: hypothetical protein ENH43_02800 [Phycisphaerales bacterium]|nr:hypothetical protein [Phycisphaerales bacterium]
MKDSKEYSRKIRELYRSLKRKYPKVQKVTYDDPVEAIVYAVVSENTSETAAQSAIKRIADNFVDLNDLRVSLTEEIVEMLGADTPLTRDTASALSRALGAVFVEYNTVSLEALKRIGKRPARQALEKIDGTSPFVVDYCMLTSLQGHAIPLTKKMIEYLRSNKMVHSTADEQQIEGFLARQISAENAYEFYALLRRQSESRRAKRKTKKKTTPKVKTKAAAKTKKKVSKTKKCKK